MSASFERKPTADASIDENNASIKRNDASIHDKDSLIEKLRQLKQDGTVSLKDAVDAEKVIASMEPLQIISSTEVMNILDCQTTKARLVIKMMETQNLIKAIHGKGKGKYILMLNDELSSNV